MFCVSVSGAAACDARDVKASFRLLLNDLRLCVWAVWDGWAMTCGTLVFKLDVWQWALAQQQAAKLCLLSIAASEKQRNLHLAQ